MIKLFPIVGILLFGLQLVAQRPEVKSLCLNKEFENEVRSYINYSVPIITVDQFKENTSDYIILDARELEEYEVSHIPNAKYIGYKKPQLEQLEHLDKSKSIVVYCSIGYRSEKMGERLQKMGFSNVYNLYGSIFEWCNQDQKLCDKQGNETLKIHGYNKNWSRWILSERYIKLY